MIESRGGCGPLDETVHPVDIGDEPGGQQLQCDLAAQPGLFGQVYFSHSTRAQRSQDIVWTQLRSRGQHPLGPFPSNSLLLLEGQHLSQQIASQPELFWKGESGL